MENDGNTVDGCEVLHHLVVRYLHWGILVLDIWRCPEIGIPQELVGLEWETLLKWMMTGAHFRTAPYDDRFRSQLIMEIWHIKNCHRKAWAFRICCEFWWVVWKSMDFLTQRPTVSPKTWVCWHWSSIRISQSLISARLHAAKPMPWEKHWLRLPPCIEGYWTYAVSMIWIYCMHVCIHYA